MAKSILIICNEGLDDFTVKYLLKLGYRVACVAVKPINVRSVEYFPLCLESGETIQERLSQLFPKFGFSVVISFLNVHHDIIAKTACQFKAHAIFLSHSSDLDDLSDAASAAGVAVLSECGVSPGLDKMCAQRLFDQIDDQKGEVKDFFGSYRTAGKQSCFTESVNAAYFRGGALSQYPVRKIPVGSPELSAELPELRGQQFVIHHSAEVVFSADRRETYTHTLLADSRHVLCVAAICAHCILNGVVQTRGILKSIDPSVYKPVLTEVWSLPGVSSVDKILAQHLWMRAESKPNEQRMIFSPPVCAILHKAGFRVTVEDGPQGCWSSKKYERPGITIVPPGSWTSAPNSAIIAGLKELPESKSPLVHRHIFFAHCYKSQNGWQDILSRFHMGQGLLWDLEFLVDDTGRRVAAFGKAAGLAGAAVAIRAWIAQQSKCKLGPLSAYKSLKIMIASIRKELQRVGGKKPTMLVIGAKGRCGGGAVHVAEACGLEVIKWDVQETKKGGPFPELLKHDILLNGIYLTKKIAPFLTLDMLREPGRQLSVFCDVSCDYTSPNNPFPVYNRGTEMEDPTVCIVPEARGIKPFNVIAIDHLPSLLPRDSSAEFSSALAPHLIALKDSRICPVWSRATALFHSKIQEMKRQKIGSKL